MSSLLRFTFVKRELALHSTTERANTGIRTVDCPIRFLGCWDTVKSYGGLRPVMLPHLRHNPSVKVVRHALALDEKRGWFEPTTWGWLDSDKKHDPDNPMAISRIDTHERELLDAQDVLEVWFTGCHSDIGGGIPGATPDIALRWMLGEASASARALNPAGVWFLGAPAEVERPGVTESRSWVWNVIECAPRRQINNSRKCPTRQWAALGASKRNPLEHPRAHIVRVHESVSPSLRSKSVADGVTVTTACTLRTALQR